MEKITEKEGTKLMDGAMKLLKDYCAEHGVALEPNGRFTYNNDMIRFKVTFNRISSAGTVVETSSEKSYKLYAQLSRYALPDLGSDFRHNGKVYKVVGWSSRARKFPVIAVDAAGNRWKFSEALAANNNLKAPKTPLKVTQITTPPVAPKPSPTVPGDVIF